MAITIKLPAELAAKLDRHLASGQKEQLAFLLCQWAGDVASVFDFRAVGGATFDLQTPWHLSLSDEERAAVIKWAHDRGGCLIEAHAHRLGTAAAFSPTDLIGLAAFVPHVWWRLRHRPYAALVFDGDTFDGLAWRAEPRSPERVERLVAEGRPDLLATGLTAGKERWA
jgi:hypothetical protein